MFDQNIIPIYLNRPVTTNNVTVFTSLLDKLTPMGIKNFFFENWDVGEIMMIIC